MIAIQVRVTDAFGQKIEKLTARFNEAISAAMNMLQSMLLESMRDAIQAGGNFGDRWTSGLKSQIEGTGASTKITFSHDMGDIADVFYDGAVHHGKPLMWLPFPGEPSLAEGAGGGLYSGRGSKPLLFSMATKLPVYFGVESVTIPPKWALDNAVQSTLQNFRAVFDEAWANAGR